MNKGPFLVRRLGRSLFWRSPLLYRHLGRVRERGDCSNLTFDLWLGGFPRSANTFSAEAFLLANPSVRLASHPHIPPLIIRYLDAGKPGIFLIRKPEDAVISWAILWGGYLEESLDYYIDFHRALLPHASRLFVATFEMVTEDFGAVIRRFNQHFGTRYASFEHQPETVAECFSQIDHKSPLSGSDLTACRPSTKRAQMKPKLRLRLRQTPILIRKLEVANQLYVAFTGAAEATAPQRGPDFVASSEPPYRCGQTQWPGCRLARERREPASLVQKLSFSLPFTAATQTMDTTDFRPMLSYWSFRLKKYTLPVLFVGLAVLVRLALDSALHGRQVYSFFFVAIFLTAWTCGTSETFFAVLLGFFAANWFIIEPRQSLLITGADGWCGAGLYFFIGCAIVWCMKSEQVARLLALSSAVEARRRLAEVEDYKAKVARLEEELGIIKEALEEVEHPLITINPSGTIGTWNSAATNLSGYSALEAVGQPISLFLLPDQEGQTGDVLTSILREENSVSWEAKLKCKASAMISVRLTVSALKTDSGKRLGAAVSVHALGPDQPV